MDCLISSLFATKHLTRFVLQEEEQAAGTTSIPVHGKDDEKVLDNGEEAQHEKKHIYDRDLHGDALDRGGFFGAKGKVSMYFISHPTSLLCSQFVDVLPGVGSLGTPFDALEVYEAAATGQTLRGGISPNTTARRTSGAWIILAGVLGPYYLRWSMHQF